MRKSLLKTAVSAVIVGAVVALSSVAAWADTTYTLDFGSDAVRSVLGVSNNKTNVTTGQDYSVGTNNYFKVNLAGQRSWDTGMLKISSTSDKIKFTTNSNGATLVISAAANKSGDGEATGFAVTGCTAQTITGTTSVEKTFNLGEAGDYEINLSVAKTARVYTVAVTESGSTTTVPLTLAGTSSFASDFELTKNVIDTAADNSALTITLSYSGNDYYIANKDLTINDLTPVHGDLQDPDKITGYTYDVAGLTKTAKTYAISTTIVDGAEGSVTYKVGNAEATSVAPTINYGQDCKINYVGEDYTMPEQTVNANNITSNMTISGEGSALALSVDLSDLMVSNASIPFNKNSILNVSELDTINFTSGNTYSLNSYYSFIAGSSNKISANSSTFIPADKSLLVGESTTVTATKRLELGGGGSKTARAVKFTVGNTAGNLYVYSNSSGSDRTLALLKESDNSYVTKAAGSTTGTCLEGVYSIAANETYYLYSTANGINIAYIAADVELVSNDIAGTSALLSGTDYYAYKNTADGVSYIIHGVTSDELNYGSLKLKSVTDNSTKTTLSTDVSTTTVYTGVKFSDDSEITVEQLNTKFGKDYVAMFTLPFTDRIDTSHTYALEWVDGTATE